MRSVWTYAVWKVCLVVYDGPHLHHRTGCRGEQPQLWMRFCSSSKSSLSLNSHQCPAFTRPHFHTSTTTFSMANDPHFVTLGMFIIDEFSFADENGLATGKTVPPQGSGHRLVISLPHFPPDRRWWHLRRHRRSHMVCGSTMPPLNQERMHTGYHRTKSA